MRLKFIFLLTVLLAGLLPSFPAQADDVRISTQFPSPYGTYGTLEATGTSTFADSGAAGNVDLVSGQNGRVSVGNANPEGNAGLERILGVSADSAGYTASFRFTNGWGIEMGYLPALAAAGSLQANSAGGQPGTLYLNPAGGGVAIASTTAPVNTLMVGVPSGGAVPIGITRSGTTGDFKFSREADGNYYANYA